MRLGVTLYVLPESNPVWLQLPSASVVTEAGIAPLPDTNANVIVTPAIPTPPLVFTEPDAAYVAVKFRLLAAALKLREAGEKVKPARLGVTLYVLPSSNPD